MPSPVRLRGVLAAALTPLGADLSPDERALHAHLRTLLAIGCDGINLLGTTGQAFSLGVEQRVRVMDGVAEAGFPLGAFMVGTGTSALADTVALTRRAVAAGYAGALVIPPFYYKGLDEDGVFDYYCAVVDGVADARLRLYLYHFPAMSAVPITAALIERLRARYGATIAGVKDSAGEPGFASGLARSFPDLAVFPSSEATLADAQRDGYAGCISATVNVLAPLAARIAPGDEDAARRIGAARAVFARRPLIPAIHAAVAALRRDASFRRTLPPLSALADADADALLEELRAVPGFALVEEAFAAQAGAGTAARA